MAGDIAGGQAPCPDLLADNGNKTVGLLPSSLDPRACKEMDVWRERWLGNQEKDSIDASLHLQEQVKPRMIVRFRC